MYVLTSHCRYEYHSDYLPLGPYMTVDVAHCWQPVVIEFQVPSIPQYALLPYHQDHPLVRAQIPGASGLAAGRVGLGSAREVTVKDPHLPLEC